MKQIEPLVIGIDVGGRKNGYHAVALREGEIIEKTQKTVASEMVDWCRNLDAQAIGIDAPCRWRSTDSPRLAEIELAKRLISSFSTPAREISLTSSFYEWMLVGEELYQLLEPTYHLFVGEPVKKGEQVCFETFPHAVACALAGEIVPAKQKETIRRKLLMTAEIDISPLTNMDYVDAALCALTAQHLLAGTIKTYGDATDGMIVVPSLKD